MQGEQAVVDWLTKLILESDSLKIDPVDFKPVRFYVVEQHLHETEWCFPAIERCRAKIDAKSPQSLLLQLIRSIVHSRVQQDLRRRRTWMCLKADSEPSVTLVSSAVRHRCGGVGKREEAGLPTTFLSKPLLQQIKLVIEHFCESFE